jgi:hypothetical protein
MRTVALLALTVAAGAAAIVGATQPPTHTTIRDGPGSGKSPGACPDAVAVAARSASKMVAGTRSLDGRQGLAGPPRPKHLVPTSTVVIDTTNVAGEAVRVEVLVDARAPTGLTVAVPEVLIVTCPFGRYVVSGAAP